MSLEEEYDLIQRALAAAQETLPVKARRKKRGYPLSERTLGIIHDRIRARQRSTSDAEWAHDKIEFDKSMKHSCAEDKREHHARIAKELLEAMELPSGKTRVASLTAELMGKSPSMSRATPSAETTDELLQIWADFCYYEDPLPFGGTYGKFAATEAEWERPNMPDLGAASERDEELPEELLERTLRSLAKDKACGWDDIPAEVYQNSKAARDALFRLIRRCWKEEGTPEAMMRGVFIPIFKNKGSSDAPDKYRWLCLACHCEKFLDKLFLNKMAAETEQYLPETQAGFRADRGTVDNVFALAEIIHEILGADEKMVVVFLDLVAAFDSCSHKCIDAALAEAGASNKTRAMFRAMYSKATGIVRVQNIDGESDNAHTAASAATNNTQNASKPKEHTQGNKQASNFSYTEPFPIERGVLQGQCSSPWLLVLVFVLLLECSSMCSNGAIRREELTLD